MTSVSAGHIILTPNYEHGKTYKIHRTWRDSYVARACDSWSEGCGFDPRARSLLVGTVSV